MSKLEPLLGLKQSLSRDLEQIPSKGPGNETLGASVRSSSSGMKSRGRSKSVLDDFMPGGSSGLGRAGPLAAFRRVMKGSHFKNRGAHKEIKLQTAHVAFKHLEDYAREHLECLPDHDAGLEDEDVEVDEMIDDILGALTRKHSAREHRLRKTTDSIREAIKQSAPEQLHRAIEEARYILGEPRISHVMNEWRYKLQRVKFAFFFLVTALVSVSFSIGPQVQFFVLSLAVNNDEEVQGSFVQTVGFFLQPFVLCFLALLGDELCDLVLDAFDSPSLVTCRSMMLACLTEPRGYPSASHCRILTVWFGCLYEIVPLGCALAHLNPQLGHIVADLWQGYLIGGMLMTVVTSLGFLVADLKVHLVLAGRGALSESRIPSFTRIRSTINELNVHPGSMVRAGVLEIMHVHLHEDFSDEVSKDKMKMVRMMSEKELDERRGGRKVAVVLVSVASVVWSAMTFAVMVAGVAHVPLEVAFGTMVLVVVILSVALMKGFPGMTGGAYWFVLLIFVLVTITLIASAEIKVAKNAVRPLMSRSLDVHSGDVDLNGLPLTWRGNQTSPYTVCSMSWYNDLKVLDLAALANAAYEPNEAAVRDVVRESFEGTDLKPEVKFVNSYNKLPRWLSVQFHREGSNRKTWVIAIKGSSTKEDFYTDTELFATIKVLQIFNTISPILTIVPRAFVRWMIFHVVLGGAWAFEQHIWSKLTDHIDEIQRNNPGDQIMLTGHSLGGCLAQVIAGRLALRALVFSSPGISFSDHRFSVASESLKRNVLVVVPDNDVVPQVDQQTGTVQQILCRTPAGGQASAVQCHSLVKTACEIWRVCGDPRGRNFNSTCSPFVERKQLGAYIKNPDTMYQ